MQNRILAEARTNSSGHIRSLGEMEGISTLPQTRRLGFRKQLPPWPPAVLGAGDLAEVHPTQGARAWNRKEVRMAHFPTHILDSLEKRRYRVQGNAGTFAALFTAINARGLHPGNYASKANCPSGSHVACLFFPSGIANARVVLNARKPATLIYRAQLNRGAKGTHFCGPLAPQLIPAIQVNSFGMYGGDDGARTRDLCRDRAAF